MQYCKKVAFAVLGSIFTFLSGSQVQAQVDKNIGSGTSGNGEWTYPTPMQDAKPGSRMQFLYLASELQAAGMTAGNINAIKFNILQVSDPTDPNYAIEEFTIKLGGTATASLDNSKWEPGTNQVFGPVDHTPVAGINAFTLATPWFWNGTDNIVVEICNGRSGATSYLASRNSSVPWTTGLSFNGSHSYGDYSQQNLCGYDDGVNSELGDPHARPDIILNWTVAPPCTSAGLTAGTATASISSLCAGEPFAVTLTGATVATGLTYQWQSSANGSTWSNISGATSFLETMSQSASTYYRAVVTCANGGSANSVPVQVIAPTPIGNTTFTINNNAPAGGGNFRSFNDAYNAIRCGINGPVVFNVDAASGPYNEQLLIKPVPGASAANTITFNGNGAEIAFTSSNNNQRAVIRLDDADHFIFNNLTVTAGGTDAEGFGYGIFLTNNADSNVINQCRIKVNPTASSGTFAAIVASAADAYMPVDGASSLCDGNRFTGNHITGGAYGIVLTGSDTRPLAGNVVKGNKVEDFYTTAIYVESAMSALVDSNVISRPNRTDGYEVTGILVTGFNARMVVSRNTITNIFGGANTSARFIGIYFSAATGFFGQENVISNNLIYSINGGGNVYGLYNEASANVNYFYNTVALDGDGSGLATDNVTVGFYQVNADGVLFNNNNIAVTRTGYCANAAMWYASLATSITSDRNNYYVAKGSGKRMMGWVNGVEAGFLANWRSITAQDANSVSADPMFTDVAAGNLQPTNPAIDNVGNAITGITADITTAVRSSTTPDVGAIEFQSVPCATPVAGTAALSEDAVCVDKGVSIELTGNSMGAGQTYQWMSADTETGTYTNVGGASANPTLELVATTSKYYKVQITCGAASVTSNIVALTVYQALAPQHYTINKGMPASATNFVSFGAAKSALDCGIAGPVVFDVVKGSGPYDEQLILMPVKGATRINTVTFAGHGETIRFGSTDNEQRAVIKLDDANHIILDSLSIDTRGGTYGYGVQLINNADSNIIRGCTITSSTTSSSQNHAGIVINASHSDAVERGATNCDDNLMEKNAIVGGYYGITVVGDPNYSNEDNESFIYRNKVLNNTVLDFYAYGIYALGTGFTAIEDNIISRPARTSVGAFTGIYLSQTHRSASVTRNKVFNPFGGNLNSTAAFTGIHLNEAGYEPELGRSFITNNVIYNINGNGAQTGINCTSPLYLSIYHNTISLDNTASTATAGTTGILVFSGGNSEIRNNIISITRGGTGNKYGVNLTGDRFGVELNKNNYYIKGTGGNNFTGYRDRAAVTIEDWVALSAKDVNSVSIDPVFEDAATGKLKPGAAPLDNTGDGLGVAADIAGVTRSTDKPDIGAYEFTIPACVTPVAGTASVTPDAGICMGSKVNLNLSGNTVNGNQTYQWQKSLTGNGAWENVGELLYKPAQTTEVLASYYFRCYTACAAGSDTSAPVKVTLNAALPAGVYTINPNGSGNFISFTAAVDAMKCGIAGAVTFDVAPGTYTEQVLMRKIPGAAATSRVTFRSANGAASSVILTAAGTTAANYVLKLDSAHYITYKDMTITASSATNGRVIELSGTSSYDSLLGNTINAPVATTTATSRAAVFSSALEGAGVVLKGNTINNGASGIYIAGNTSKRSNYLTLEENTVKGFYQYGIYSRYNNRVTVLRNKVTVSGTVNNTTYGIYAGNADTTFRVTNNEVVVTNTTATVYGLYTNVLGAQQGEVSAVSNNSIVATDGNTGSLYGLYITGTINAKAYNNVVSLHTTGSDAYGLYSYANTNGQLYNNSVLNTSTATGANVAAYVNDDYEELRSVDVRNNIFSHEGGGIAWFVGNADRVNSDYNLLYTTGGVLVEQEFWGQYATLADWNAASGYDVNSIVYKPAFLNAVTLRPDVTNPEVWAIHGRGVQIQGNAKDYSDNQRPASLEEGVPDLGAYEFLPGSQPVAATSATVPVAGQKQVFVLGTDTVCVINWGATVPSSITVRRYSGIAPASIAAGTQYMYFYVDAEVAAGGAYEYSIEQKYLDSWRGFIDREQRIRLGKTDAANAWGADLESGVDINTNYITQANLTYLDKVTGLADARVAYPAEDDIKMDSSHMGTRFWLGYGKTERYGMDAFNVYIGGAAKDANVTVKINGTTWIRNYHIPAGQFIKSEDFPRNGVNGAYLNVEGLSDKGISIESDEPIAAYAYGEKWGNAHASCMLLPTGAYGMEYYALSFRQYTYDTEPYHSWFYVIADHDNTMVEITPSGQTTGGRKAGVPFVITLNKGQVYNVLGAGKNQDATWDLSGSRIRSLSNAAGKCYPIAVFSGNSSAFVDCDSAFTPSGEYLVQQNIPVREWGTKYLTAPSSYVSRPKDHATNFYRVQVKDASTIVKRNGIVLTGLENNYYTYLSNTADYIEADKPVAVVQFFTGETDKCGFDTTSAEMIAVMPVDHGVHKTTFFRAGNSNANPTYNYLTLIIPDAGLASLKIDGSNVFDDTYAHPGKPGYSVVVKRWKAENLESSVVESDSAFTGLVYNNYYYSYGYTLGTMVNSLLANPGITNVYDSTGNYSAYTCVGTPFKLTVKIPVMPTKLTWKTGGVPALTPEQSDVVQNAPTAIDTVLMNGRSYYVFALPDEYKFTATGEYSIPVAYENLDLESCNHTSESILKVKVIGAPVADYTLNYGGCPGDIAQFKGTATTANGAVADRWKWSFGDNTTGWGEEVDKRYPHYTRDTTYNVQLRAIIQDGCIADKAGIVNVKADARLELLSDSVVTCVGSGAAFNVKEPVTGVTYNWYLVPENGTAAGTGTSWTLQPVTAKTYVYLSAVNVNGCVTVPRKEVVADVKPVLAAPVVTVDSTGISTLRFAWAAVTNATGYEVSTDGGVTWSTPSSGTLGLTHTISGLQPGREVKIQVRVKGELACQEAVSAVITATTLLDSVFAANAFSPNGDNLNDEFKIRGEVIRSLHLAIFNQWGEKVFESSDKEVGWKGDYKGKPQPSGVYIYVCNIILMDGSSTTKKGSVNLVR
ncbi:gliding motility-associated-like protein [Filimonas zeae]|uniref:right-handed parallel beta-helix repeat-containing protein n=1 Tax=Filimonas zeae TaxID=1737353 RepID=UPI001663BD65|nr:right-handed parallel beta-helix repeat-containing protein [Filimonas zeae]MDR6341012.1 gliding motility-associated-like protein [Filimonas zeae]